MEKKINKILHAPKKNPAGKQDAKQALILFTRLPIAGKTKTRLIPYLKEEGAKDIHLALLRDFARLYQEFHRREKEVKLFLFFSSTTANEVVEGAFDPGKKESTKEQEERKEERKEESKKERKEGRKKERKEGSKEDIKKDIAEMKMLRKLFPDAKFVPQEGEDIFLKMKNAFLYTAQKGYSFSYLVGADIPFLSTDSFYKVFSEGRKGKNALGESLDGGYYGIGLQSMLEKPDLDKIFSLGKKMETDKVNMVLNRTIKPKYTEREKQQADIFEYTKTALYATGLPLLLLKKRRDIDDKEDIIAYRQLIPYNKALQSSYIGKVILR